MLCSSSHEYLASYSQFMLILDIMLILGIILSSHKLHMLRIWEKFVDHHNCFIFWGDSLDNCVEAGVSNQIKCFPVQTPFPFHSIPRPHSKCSIMPESHVSLVAYHSSCLSVLVCLDLVMKSVKPGQLQSDLMLGSAVGSNMAPTPNGLVSGEERIEIDDPVQVREGN